MKFSTVFSTAAFASLAQASFKPQTSFSLTFWSDKFPYDDKPLSLTPEGNLVYDPNSDDVFHGFTLPDGRVRVGGTDQWLAVNDLKQLAVVTARPTNWKFTDDDFFANGTEFKAQLRGGGYATVYTQEAEFPTRNVPLEFKLRVNWN